MQVSAHHLDAYEQLLEHLSASLRNRHDQSHFGIILLRPQGYNQMVSNSGYRDIHTTLEAWRQELDAALRDRDELIQLGESKFAALLDNVRNEGHIMLAANKLQQVSTAEFSIIIKMGIVLFPQHGKTVEELMMHAEAALLVAESSDEAFSIHNPDNREIAADKWSIAAELEQALADNELEVFYQPKVDAVTRSTVAAEALLRWFSATRGAVSPELFVSVADTTNQIEALTWFALTTSVRQIMAMADLSESFKLAVNVTPNVIEKHDLPTLIGNALGLWGLSPERLIIELTEGALIQNAGRTKEVLTELRRSGIQVSIDDFGTGYSSLSYFRDIPADELKIDKSFVINMLDNPNDRKLVTTIINLARDFGLHVTAEGVENGETADLLSDLGCDQLQGDFFSRPVPKADFVSHISKDALRKKPPTS